MRESVVEKYLKKEVENIEGLCVKFVSPGLRGVPDRIVIMPGGFIYFVEVKAPDEKLSKQQIFRMQQFRELGANCQVVDSKDTVDEFIYKIEEVVLNEVQPT